jgi:hypothetical protein
LLHSGRHNIEAFLDEKEIVYGKDSKRASPGLALGRGWTGLRSALRIKKTGKSKAAVKKAIKKVGNSRKKVNRALGTRSD